MEPLTPKEIVAYLDQYIVGQDRAKRAVAIAMRNRWRRRRLSPEMAAEVYPKNILLIGPTGVGKTEIARRLSQLARAPFVKVEASKYSEVGYHGRDVESMVRDLVEAAVLLVRAEKATEVLEASRSASEQRVLECLHRSHDLDPADDGPELRSSHNVAHFVTEAELAAADERRASRAAARADLLRRLRAGELEETPIDIEIVDKTVPTLNITTPQGTESMGIDARAMQEIWGRSTGPRTKFRRLSVAEARRLVEEEEADRLIDQDALIREALERAQNDGIIFLDEVDKIVGSGGSDGPDVSREGVQRDLLPIVEGCSVFTRYGNVTTDHMLFIAAGAFHLHKPSELIPELQGRFPIRVALRALTQEDFVRILSEPRNSLTRQYVALIGTEGVELQFTPDGLASLAAVAFKANRTTQNIGARRLMTVLEKLLEDLFFDAPEKRGARVVVDARMVEDRLGDAADEDDLIPYQL
jgi:ATP-dependent HslUV protease ATP-binding subunit HslU